MTRPNRPNYFLILELDPSQADSGTIVDAIYRKQKAWAMRVNADPDTGRRRDARQCLEMLADIKEVMLDPLRRAEEAEKARQVLAVERRDALRKLDGMIEVLSASGFVLDCEVELLARESPSAITEAEVRDRIRVPIVGHVSTPPKAATPLDVEVAESMEHLLGFVEKNDLYEFLDLPRTAEFSECKARAENMNRELRRTCTTALSEAQRELAERCLSVFRSLESRAQYDAYLQQQEWRGLPGLLEAVRYRLELPAPILEALLRKTLEQGMSSQEAIAWFQNTTAGIRFEPPRADPHQLQEIYDDLLSLPSRIAVATKSIGMIACGSQGEEVVINLIQRGVQLPTCAERAFETYLPDQDVIEFKMMENDDSCEIAEVNGSSEIGTATLCLPPGLAEGSVITVRFKLDEQERISIEAVLSSGDICEMTLAPAARRVETPNSASPSPVTEHLTGRDERVYGIDLGAAYSCIATLDENDKPAIIRTSFGEAMPSVVYFESKDNIVVGEPAKNAAVTEPDRVIQMVKRHMGNDEFTFIADNQEYSADIISSFILRKLVQEAELTTGAEITNVVITCPAWFGADQRQATRRAGVLANLNVLKIVDDPAAAVIHYGLLEEEEQTVLVYDLGEAFDVTAIKTESHGIVTIFSDGDHYLGGRSWDETIVAYLAKQFQEETGMGEDILEDMETWRDLLQEVERAKRYLLEKTTVKVRVMYGGERAKVELTREKFDELTSHLLEKTIVIARDLVDKVGAESGARFDKILLAGGSTRMPQVLRRIRQEFPDVECLMHDPEVAVAKGAAMYGRIIASG